MRHAAARRDVANGGLNRRVANDQRRRGIADKIVDLLDAIGGVHGEEHEAAAQAGQIDHQSLGRLLDLQGNAVAGLQTKLREQRRVARGIGGQPVEGPVARPAGTARRLKGETCPVIGEGSFDQRVEGEAHGGSQGSGVRQLLIARSSRACTTRFRYTADCMCR